ncbi:MAG: hypothetical protein R3A48_00355 [Polyangiales bacterium]
MAPRTAAASSAHSAPRWALTCGPGGRGRADPSRRFDGLDNLFSLDGALIRVVGSVFLASAERRRSPQASILDNLMVNATWNRRFLRTPNGGLESTNDFFLSLGSSAGF